MKKKSKDKETIRGRTNTTIVPSSIDKAPEILVYEDGSIYCGEVNKIYTQKK